MEFENIEVFILSVLRIIQLYEIEISFICFRFLANLFNNYPKYAQLCYENNLFEALYAYVENYLDENNNMGDFFSLISSLWQSVDSKLYIMFNRLIPLCATCCANQNITVRIRSTDCISLLISSDIGFHFFNESSERDILIFAHELLFTGQLKSLYSALYCFVQHNVFDIFDNESFYQGVQEILQKGIEPFGKKLFELLYSLVEHYHHFFFTSHLDCILYDYSINSNFKSRTGSLYVLSKLYEHSTEVQYDCIQTLINSIPSMECIQQKPILKSLYNTILKFPLAQSLDFDELINYLKETDPSISDSIISILQDNRCL